MIKRTLYFSSPSYLSLKDAQLVIKLPEVEKNNELSQSFKNDAVRTVPIEDIGIVVLDNKQITITHGLLNALIDNNVAVISCGSNGLPTGLVLPLCCNTVQSERFTDQINCSLPLKKQLWQQTIQAKISNQAALLKKIRPSVVVSNMQKWVNDVKSGDSMNLEGRAAAYYWKNIFADNPNFLRDRDGDTPNNLLNYGYAILRAIVARALVSSGMLPTLGIHHHNRYNAYCLADDIMEPYRPYVDELVISIMEKYRDTHELTKEIKIELLGIATRDVVINGQQSPLLVGVSTTTASLYRCFVGDQRKISYPIM